MNHDELEQDTYSIPGRFAETLDFDYVFPLPLIFLSYLILSPKVRFNSHWFALGEWGKESFQIKTQCEKMKTGLDNHTLKDRLIRFCLCLQVGSIAINVDYFVMPTAFTTALC